MINITEKKLQSWDRMAMAVANNSHDIETKVGALLIHSKTGALLSTGFNGFIRGADDKSLPNTRPDKYPYMVHAETNLIFNCARHGVSTNDCILYCTLSPCVNCARAIWQAGISEVYFKEKYRDFDINCNMQDLDLIVTQPGLGGFYRMILEAKCQK